MNVYWIAFSNVVCTAHDRPIVAGHVTQTQPKIPFRTSRPDVSIQAMQITLREPQRLTADMMQALSQLPEVKPRRPE
jgi:hypothetical protein